jgi:multicomponent Na+:H+ antiporter subunit F
MIAIIIAAAVALSLALTLPRLFTGPTLYDRALAASAVVLRAALACAALATAAGEAAWVDAAIGLVLAALVFNAAVLKFFRARSFQPPLVRPMEDA